MYLRIQETLSQRHLRRFETNQLNSSGSDKVTLSELEIELIKKGILEC